MDDVAPAKAPLSPTERIAAVLDWWRAAGVTQTFHDVPQDWLAPPEDKAAQARTALPPVPVPEEPPAPRLGGDPASWPTDLPGFAEWWLNEPSLPFAGRRLPPRGVSGAALMVLLAMPESEDEAELLSASHGRLVGGIARALGVGEDQLYIASALPSHQALPDWAALREGGMDAVLQHHVALAQPQKLLVLGAADILPLLGHDPAQAAPGIHALSAVGMDKPVLASFAPDALLARWQLRAQLWRALLDWTNGDA
ncbi:hypothetical protein PK98_04110 [Croceibacterium mercuriale]|uniref:Uracil-DNA glycosylase-like domain-containing protein n=1 Tax=Croceibacterium mercuriale TaxID=1572751 RepID=A0A0B2C0L7_9SPHN|nr:hypothetical protein [Croceibacterium mercuriale]KHL25802.1 hypothetical protein PK98_04110 [Croceibacterium mercuriale]